ncbi:pyridoxal-phosphate dependent enzyme [Pendulispora albinea]|uniref:Pyridoxal-phosphate dependent enzyme n=1 Tax=Pendulispora albinea TaxID=2741071 RepID=A0ABZ2LU50_9BACT
MSDTPLDAWSMRFHLRSRSTPNPGPVHGPSELAELAWVGLRDVAPARELLSAFMKYAPTPLRRLSQLERALGLGAILIKDEGKRMGLGSFKALGGAHAVIRHARRKTEREPGKPVTVACASAGNHGLSVAAGARAVGARSVVYLNETVPSSFEERLQAQGAETVRAGHDYEESLELAEARAAREGWALISDTLSPAVASEPRDVWEARATGPREVMQGYSVLMDEAARACEEQGGPATHVFVQAGVGGLASVAASYLFERWGEAVTLVVVEPAGAACVLESVRLGAPTRIAPGRTTLGRLDCREPSLLAFHVLSRVAHGFVTVTDAAAGQAAVQMAHDGVALSPCGASGGAGLMAVCKDASVRSALGLDAGSRVLLFGTEAAGAP